MLTLWMASLASAQQPPPIVNGVETSDYPQVGVLSLERTGLSHAFCSGTLITPEWVLTAAHCVEAAAGYELDELTFTLTSDLHGDQGHLAQVPIVEWQTHPDWDGDWDGGGDLGVMRLGERIEAVEPMALSDAPMEGWEGTELIHVGFGITTDDARDSGTKRLADIPILSVDERVFYSYEEGQNLCGGDSGGPSLVQDSETGEWRIVGLGVSVIAYSGPDRCADGMSSSTRVDPIRDWILEVTAEPEPQETGDTAGPPVPTEEPGLLGCAQAPVRGVAGLGLLVGLGLLLRRRRD